MFKKRSVVLLLVVGVLVLYGFVNYNHQERVLRDNYGKVTVMKERHMLALLILSSMLGKQGLWDVVQNRLEDARQLDFIDYYFLQYKGKTLWCGSFDRRLCSIQLPPENINRAVITDDVSYQALPFGNDYLLLVGISKNTEAYVDRNMPRFTALLYEQAIYYGLIVLAVALWVFRDLFQVLRKLRTGRVSEIDSRQTKSIESDLLARGLQSFAQSVDSLRARNQTLDRQVLPSLQSELQSGMTPPYDFRCTLVRTDINQFSTIYSEHNVSEFMKTINEFFTEVSHIVSDYGGLMHEFVGDEVIFYFKDEASDNSFLTALSAVRDIHAAAARIHGRTLPERGYPFTVKTSLGRGTLRFGPLVNGFSLAGSVLIETVRILSHIHEKDESIAYFDRCHALSVAPLVESRDIPGKIQLKGFRGERELSAYEKHQPPSEVLLQSFTDVSRLRSLKNYRGDDDLKEILRITRENANAQSSTWVLNVLHEFKYLPATKLKENAGHELWQWIDAEALATSNEKILSSLISLLPYLIPRGAWTSEMTEKLVSLSNHADPRIAANAIDALVDYQAKVPKKLISRFAESQDNRLQANALIFTGITEISEDLVMNLKKGLRKKDPAKRASTIFALGTIAALHRQRDLVYYDTQVEFLELVNQLKKFTKDSDASVRKQALQAQEKIAASHPSGDDRFKLVA